MRKPHRSLAETEVLAALQGAATLFEEAMCPAAREYLQGRGFSEATITGWRFGWALGRGTVGRGLAALGLPAAAVDGAGLVRDGRDFFFDRVMVPICDPWGDVVAFAGRMLGAGEPKYVNSPESVVYEKRKLLFGLDRARGPAGKSKRLVLMEGQLDVVAAHQMGICDAVATCGPALTADHLELVKDVIPGGVLVLCFDADDAGHKATVSALDLCWSAGVSVRVQGIAGGKDAAALLQAGEVLTLAPISGGAWLINHLTKDAPTDRADRLALADLVLLKLSAHPDRHWRELHAELLAEKLGLGKRLVLDRMKGEKAPESPAGGRAEEGEMDGGFHRAVVAKIRAFLVSESLAPDAVAGWMRGDSGLRIGVKTRDLVNRFLFQAAPFFDSLSRERVTWTLDALVQDARKERRAAVLAPLLVAESSEAGRVELVRWVRAVTGREDPTDVAVMAHFLWQVKRRAAGLEVDHDVMPILVGKQGDGKSRAVKRLCAPFLELVLAVNATTLTDDRCKEALADYYVGIWDELQGGNKADVQALKNIISADVVAYRELGGHTHNVLPKSITLIGTSNDPVKDIIPDTTGARRYYEVKSNPERCDWDEINAISYPLVWSAVAHLDEAPIKAHLVAVREHQLGLIHVDPVILWLQGEVFGELVLVESDRRDDTAQGPAMATQVIPAYEIGVGEVCDWTYRRFSRWCKLSGQASIAPNKFGGRLKALGIERQRDKTAGPTGGRAWRYHLPTPCPEDWAVADRLRPVPVKTAADRQMTHAAAAAAFGTPVDFDA